jgi:DNA repair exonuclease SbcCD ATPase subunit
MVGRPPQKEPAVNALTKLFVVLLVVVSLLSSAGFIVFVNQVQNFKVSLASVNGQLATSQSAVQSAKQMAGSLQSQLDQRATELAQQRQKNADLEAANATTVAGLNATIASQQTDSRIAAASMVNVTAALTASETLRGKLNEALTLARTDSDTANKKYLDDEIAINRLQQEGDTTRRKATDLGEQLAQAQQENDRLSTRLKEAGIDPNGSSAVARSAPPINAVVRQTGETNGIPYATISVGSAEQVTKGMVFQVIDRAAGKYLGELTINAVDLHEATGKLEGPGVTAVRAGTTEVRTQL